MDNGGAVFPKCSWAPSPRYHFAYSPPFNTVVTVAVREEDPDTPDYVPDSAATATAWATGSKTSNGRISTTAGTDEDLTTILELAQGSGRLTGNVTTASLTDASPAALRQRSPPATARDPRRRPRTARRTARPREVRGP